MITGSSLWWRYLWSEWQTIYSTLFPTQPIIITSIAFWQPLPMHHLQNTVSWTRAYSSSLLCVIIARSHLHFFKIFSNFEHFCPNFQIFFPFFALFYLLWKITHMPLLSRIGQGEHYRKTIPSWAPNWCSFDSLTDMLLKWYLENTIGIR